MAAKLPPELVKNVTADRKDGFSLNDLCHKYDISRATVHHILYGLKTRKYASTLNIEFAKTNTLQKQKKLLDIIVEQYNSGTTKNELAKMYGISIQAVTGRINRRVSRGKPKKKLVPISSPLTSKDFPRTAFIFEKIRQIRYWFIKRGVPPDTAEDLTQTVCELFIKARIREQEQGRFFHKNVQGLVGKLINWTLIRHYKNTFGGTVLVPLEDVAYII